MLYDHRNASGAAVYDVEALAQLHEVVEIDTDAGTVEFFVRPLRVNSHEMLETFKVKFRAIYPIFGGARDPLLFHCYGRLA